jgi:hypothetical protein
MSCNKQYKKVDVLMHANQKKIPVETIPGMWRGRNIGEWEGVNSSVIHLIH